MALPELDLFAALVRALTHKVRGDLSIITNDLTYFGTLLGAGEVERSKGRCKTITHALSQLSPLRDEALSIETVSVESVIRGLDRGGASFLTDVSISVDTRRFIHALTSVRDLLEARHSGARASVRYEADDEKFVVSIGDALYTSTVGSTDSLSRFASQCLGEDSVIDAVVADVIFRAHGAGLILKFSEGWCEAQVALTAVILRSSA